MNDNGSKKQPDWKLDFTELEVVQKKLLTALNDETKVALLLEKGDLEDLIDACEKWMPSDYRRLRRLRYLANGMRRLLSEAFPP